MFRSPCATVSDCISFSLDKNENGLFLDWNLLNFLTFRQKEENWTEDKQKEHNTYTKGLGTIVASGASEQRLLNTFTQEANTDEVKDFWRGVESDRNAKEYETVLENLDMAFTVERTLEHNDYINEVTTAQVILSLSHILLLKPKQHCPLIVEIFGDEILKMMHKDIIRRLTKQETEFDGEILIKLVRIVKRLQREEITRDNAVSELQILLVGRSFGECAVLKAIRNIIERVPRATLKSPIGEEYYRSNKEAAESKARKSIGRAKQPDAIINEIDQLSWGSSKGHGEAKVQEESNNLYLLCTDLIRVAVFNKDAIDFHNMNCMLGFQVVGHHITFYFTILLCGALYVMVEVGHIDVPMSLEQVRAFLTSLDTLLIISNAFWSNCIMSTEKKNQAGATSFATPSFKEMISKSRPCQLRFVLNY